MSLEKTVLHLIYRFDIGGLEKVMIECINHSSNVFKHVVISLTNVTEFSTQNLHKDIDIVALNKKPGNDFSIYLKLYRLFKKYSPDVLHTYNFPTMEYQLLGFILGIKKRIHAEHGREADDPQGKNKKHNFLRRIINPFIQNWIAVSNDLSIWLNQEVGLPLKKIRLIYNGVNTDVFSPVNHLNEYSQESVIIGTIGRLDPVKNQLSLIHVLENIEDEKPEIAKKIKIVIIGSGDLYSDLKSRIENSNKQNQIFLEGVKYDIARELSQFNIFVLPSIAEGVPMTMLEAMASGIPVICSEVGGIPEILSPETGIMLEPNDYSSWANSIIELIEDRKRAEQLAINGRELVLEKYSIQSMVRQYQLLYSE